MCNLLSCRNEYSNSYLDSNYTLYNLVDAKISGNDKDNYI